MAATPYSDRRCLANGPSAEAVNHWSRRTLLAYGAQAAGLLALTACGGGSSTPAQAATAQPAATTASGGTDAWAMALDDITQTLNTSHIRPWQAIAQSEFMAQAATLRANLGGLSEQARVAAMMKLVAKVQDLHTTLVAWGWHAVLPLTFTQFTDGVFVTGGASNHARYARAKVLAIGGVPIELALPRIGEYWPAENPQSALAFSEFLLASATVLVHAGLATNSESVSFDLLLPGANKVEPFTLGSAIGAAQGTLWPTDTVPIDRQNPSLPYWFVLKPEQNALVLRYRRCTDAPRFAQMATELFAASEQAGVRRMVVDLRDNEGGDDSVWRSFTAGLAARSQTGARGSLRVITNRRTYSAGVDAALDMLQMGALHIGEAPGQRPNFLGNVQTLNTRLSGMAFRYPTRVSTRVAGNPSAITPTIAVERSSSQHFAGLDPAMDIALKSA